MALLPLLGLVTACSSAVDEPIASTREAIAWGSDDVVSDPVEMAKRNAVVRLYGFSECSGILIAPRVVLTARHCVRGSVQKGAFHLTQTEVRIGPQGTVPLQRVPTMSIIPAFDAPIDASTNRDIATDIAILLLPPSPAINVDLFIERPSFNTQPPNYLQFAGYAVENGGGGDTRQIGMAHFISDPIAVGDSSVLEADGPSASRDGDSGGPVFLLRADGSRDVRGLVSTGGEPFSSDHFMKFADTSSPFARKWIAAMAQDQWRTPGWLARHHKTAGDYWLGEADYTGPCQPSVDQDCDRWLDANDDCPTVANPDQTETYDNGHGDACPPPPAAPAPMPTGCVVTPHCPNFTESWAVASCGGLTSTELRVDGGYPNYTRVCALNGSPETCTTSFTVGSPVYDAGICVDPGPSGGGSTPPGGPIKCDPGCRRISATRCQCI